MKKTQYNSPQRHKEHKERQIEHAKRQYEIDRLEIILDRLYRFLREREAAVALEIWEGRRRDSRRATDRIIEAIITDRLAKDKVFYRKMKYYERLRRRRARLVYKQALLDAGLID